MLAETSLEGGRRGELLGLALVTSLLLHAFVYVAALNLCLDGTRCASLVAAHPRAADEVVELAQRVTLAHRKTEARAAPNGLAPHMPARSAFGMQGAPHPLSRGQGQYWPLETWTTGAQRYYRVAYRFLYRSGTLETGVVPWAVHFRGGDPFAANVSAITRAAPLPAPPPDFVPPGTLGKALRAYFPQYTFAD